MARAPPSTRGRLPGVRSFPSHAPRCDAARNSRVRVRRRRAIRPRRGRNRRLPPARNRGRPARYRSPAGPWTTTAGPAPTGPGPKGSVRETRRSMPHLDAPRGRTGNASDGGPAPRRRRPAHPGPDGRRRRGGPVRARSAAEARAVSTSALACVIRPGSLATANTQALPRWAMAKSGAAWRASSNRPMASPWTRLNARTA